MNAIQRFGLAMAGTSAPQDRADIAEMLEMHVRQACEEYGLQSAEIFSSGGIVTLLLTSQHAWEAVIVGPDAYQLYPGFIRDSGGSIVWPNIWVANDFTLATFLGALEGAFEECRTRAIDIQ